LTLDISTWLKFTTSGSLEEVILDYPTFRKMVDTLETLDKAKPAVDLLRSSFIGFLDFVKITDTREIKLAEFLTAEGVLTVSDNDNDTFRMSSAFIDELMRRRVIPDLYMSSPKSAVPLKDDLSLDILKILQTAIQFFDNKIISNAFNKSYKIAEKLYVDGKKKKKVPRESVYDSELSRILTNWLVKKSGFNVIGQWHLDTHTYSDIVITTDSQIIVLELLATATKKDLDEHFKRILKYAEQLSADDIWIVHFTCEDGYATQKLHWPSDDRINVIHFFHDQMLVNVLMNARYVDSY
ncbi:18814_t:CDS:1, partial [Funneliformis geosporum]